MVVVVVVVVVMVVEVDDDGCPDFTMATERSSDGPITRPACRPCLAGRGPLNCARAHLDCSRVSDRTRRPRAPKKKQEKKLCRFFGRAPGFGPHNVFLFFFFFFLFFYFVLFFVVAVLYDQLSEGSPYLRRARRPVAIVRGKKRRTHKKGKEMVTRTREETTKRCRRRNLSVEETGHNLIIRRVDCDLKRRFQTFQTLLTSVKLRFIQKNVGRIPFYTKYIQ